MSFILLTLLITVALQQQSLPLSKPITVTIDSSKLYSIDLPTTIEQYQNLFITTIPIINVPTQIPTLFIQQQNLTKDCYQASNQLQGICIISNGELNGLKDKTIKLNATCIQSCQFILQAYINDVVTITFSTKYKISPKNDNFAIYEFQLATPIQSFEEIKIQAEITNANNMSKGVQMYANVGNYGALQPNQQHYQYKAIPIYKGIGIDLAKEDLPKGTWIKLAIFTNSKADISLTAQFSTGLSQHLTLGKLKYCFLSRGKEKYFILDLTSSIADISNHDINLFFFIYSGNPQIKLSFEPQFKNILQNYGLGGNLNYFLTAVLRKKHNFSGKIYIRASSQKQAYFQIGSSINPTNYIYMEQSITYLSFFEPFSMQNYIFDSYYDLPKSESQQKYLYFSVKIKVIEGGGFYASRICNQASISSCLLANSSQLFEKKFSKEAQQLPGDIFIYESLYEIYLYSRVSQCKVIKYQSNSTRYLCRIHMVGYNSNPNRLEWGMTAFSRLNNIKLSQSVPFKDMVYEDAYNYYEFSVPPNITDIEIFITTLSGEAKLVTSLIYQFPDALFINMQRSDLRMSPNNIITYKSSQLKSKVYIGVYGSSVSEYVINTIVHRHQQKSKVGLMQKMQQFFFIKQAGEIDFSMKYTSSGLWVVQIIELFGTVQSFIKANQSIICLNMLKCAFNATSKDEQILTIKSTKRSKFAVSYYVKGECRLFSLGNINFLEIQPNETQCIKFIISNNTDIQISYSQQVINSLSTNINASLAINGNKLGLLQQYTKVLSKEEIQAFCNTNNNSSKTKACILEINIEGDKKQRAQIQLSVISSDNPIVLFDDRVVPFSRRLFNKESPAYFNYLSLSTNSPVLFIKSINYQTFRIALAWVEYSSYLNSTSYQAIYPSFPDKVDNNISFSLSYFHRSLEIEIPPSTNCEECLLLVSLFAEDQYKESYLELQIVSQQGSISLGQTLQKTLNKDDFYAYQLQKAQKSQKPMLTLGGYNQGKGCYKVSVLQKTSQSPVQFVGNEIIIPQDGKRYELQVKTFEGNCKIQITYWLTDVPVRIIQPGKAYSLQLTNSSQLYLLYYHQMNQAFHLFQSIKSGYIYFYATPVYDNLREALSKDTFVFGSNSIYAGIQIYPNDSNFCYNCYYLIKIVGAPDAKGSIGVADSLTSVTLNSDEVIRQKVKANQTRYYTLSKLEATQPFKVKINVVFGEIAVKIKDGKGNELYSQSVKDEKQITLNPTIYREKYVEYLINLTTQRQTIYSLQVIDTNQVRLIEGYPLAFSFIALQVYNFAFQFSNSQQFTLLIISQESSAKYGIEISVQRQQKQKGAKNITAISSSFIGNIYSLDIKGQQGNYIISMSVNTTLKVKLLISRSKLTYLQPYTNTLSKNNTIYQIFTSGSPIMLEVFSCKGDVKLTATTNYPSLSTQQSKQTVSLQHNNIGGHYVVKSNSIEKQFYALVKSQSQLPPLFIIRYSFINELPYQYFDAVDKSLQYKVDHNNVEVKFYIPELLKKDNSLSNIKASFNLVVSDKGSDFKALMQCGLGVPLMSEITQISAFPPLETQQITHKVPRQKLKGFFKSQIQTFYVGIVMKISLKQKQQLRQLTYIYQTIEVSLISSSLIIDNSQSNAAFIFFWIVVPLVIGGAIAYLSFAYCIKRLRMTISNNQLMEEEQESNVPAISNKPEEIVDEKA